MRCTPSTIFIEVSLLGQPVSRSFTACHHGDTEMSTGWWNSCTMQQVLQWRFALMLPAVHAMTHLLAGGLVGGAMHGEDRQLQLLSPLAQLPECLR